MTLSIKTKKTENTAVTPMTKESEQLLQQYCFIDCFSAVETVKGEKNQLK